MKIRTTFEALAAASLLALAACDAPPPPSGGTSGVVSQAQGERACRDALIDFHTVDDVRIVGSEPYQGGGRFVRGSVVANSETGTRELWQCIAYGDGSTGEIAYLGDDPASGGGGPDPEVVAQDACRNAVSAETGNPTVSILGSEFSEAGTRVVIGVGPQQAPWECFAYSDGSTGNISFLGSEGAL